MTMNKYYIKAKLIQCKTLFWQAQKVGLSRVDIQNSPRQIHQDPDRHLNDAMSTNEAMSPSDAVMSPSDEELTHVRAEMSKELEIVSAPF